MSKFDRSSTNRKTIFNKLNKFLSHLKVEISNPKYYTEYGTTIITLYRTRGSGKPDKWKDEKKENSTFWHYAYYYNDFEELSFLRASTGAAFGYSGSELDKIL